MVNFKNIRYNIFGDKMKVINKNFSTELIIKNSKFICLLYKIENTSDIKKILKMTKDLHPKATHCCYAYIIGNITKSFDDGEPSGTAGMPILSVLKKEELTNILCIVVRYFGGIKLGSNGLIRAYSKSVKQCLEQIKYNKLIPGYLIKITTHYDQIKNLEYILNKNEILSKQFLEQVIYISKIEKNIISILKEKNYSYQIIEPCLIEQKKK